MPLLDNSELLNTVAAKLPNYIRIREKDELLYDPFFRDFTYKLCWSSNAIEGNTLTLDETISVIEYDEVRSGHTYEEYSEAKRLYKAIQLFLKNEYLPIDEEWILEANAVITGCTAGYRTKDVYVGTIAEATYYPPPHQDVPQLMASFTQPLNEPGKCVRDKIERIAENHIRFERIHPFPDGNGRTGRLLMNQQLINEDFLPITITEQSKYRQAFRRYDKNGDISQMVHLIGKGELEAMKILDGLQKKMNRDRAAYKKEQKSC